MTVWYPFTQMADYEPLVIDKGEGVWLYDEAGKRYLDAVSSLWVNVHGHNHPALNQSVMDQLKKVAHSTMLGLSHRPGIELAEELASRCPSDLNHVFYSDSGSTAVEIALKISFQYWHLQNEARSKFIYLEDSYHGDTIGSVGVGGIGLFHGIFGPILTEHIMVKSPAYDPEYALKSLRDALDDNEGAVAAVILEPLVQGAAGMKIHPAGYLEAVRTLTREKHVHLILDEVATGFGRTGQLFACERENVAPDILCCAKGITAGYLPLAATIASTEIHEMFKGPETLKFYHGHTYTGNPLACAVALKSLELIDANGTLDNVKRRAQDLTAWLTGLESPVLVGHRSIGLMAGLDLDVPRGTEQETRVPRGTLGPLVANLARRHGLIVRPLGDTLVLMPPLCITSKELDFLKEGIEATLNDASRQLA